MLYKLLNKIDIEVSINKKAFGFALRALNGDHSHANMPSFSFLVGYHNQNQPSKSWFRSFTYHHKMWFHVFDNRFDDYDAISDAWDNVFDGNVFRPHVDILNYRIKRITSKSH